MIESASDFVRLRESDSPDDYRRAAGEPASEEVWLEVLRAFPEKAFWVAQNKTVPHSILRILSRNADSQVRWMVARKRKAGAEILAALGSDDDEIVRAAVAQNRMTSRATLTDLAEDNSPIVREAAIVRLTADDA